MLPPEMILVVWWQSFVRFRSDQLRPFVGHQSKVPGPRFSPKISIAASFTTPQTHLVWLSCALSALSVVKEHRHRVGGAVRPADGIKNTTSIYLCKYSEYLFFLKWTKDNEY